MSKKKLKFYYSWWQMKMEGKMILPGFEYLPRSQKQALLDDGRIVEYTESSDEEKQIGKPHHERFDDSEYLGEGVKIDSEQIDKTLRKIAKKSK